MLQDIDLHVASGEIVAVLGPSGCGKSTLLRLVGGLEIPAAGAIRANPKSGNDRIAYVFQDATLLPWRTVAANVALPLEHRDIPPSERHRRVADALRRVNLADFADAYPKTLSGGMRQRTSIARALVVEPAALMLDEPFASLDEASRERLLADLLRLWSESRYTCLYVTHDPCEAVRIGHRVVVLSARPGAVREVFRIDVPFGERRPDHPQIARLCDRLWALVRNAAGSGAKAVADAD